MERLIIYGSEDSASEFLTNFSRYLILSVTLSKKTKKPGALRLCGHSIKGGGDPSPPVALTLWIRKP